MTWARTPAEADVLLEGVSLLSELGMPLVVADGGSPEEFVEAVGALPGARLVAPETGEGGRLVPQVRAALDAAGETGARWILYTEPDKRWFFRHRLAAFLAAADQHPEAGILVAARDVASFATFPQGQRLCERLFNQLFAETLGLDGDTLYGPLLIRAELIPYLARIEPEVGWGWRPCLMAVAHRLRMGIAFHTDELPCPIEQRGEDDPAARFYRMEQLAQNVRGLALGLRMPLDGVR